MGYFEGLTSRKFKTDKEGNTIFYPYGIFGKGYILPNGKKEQIQLFIIRYELIFMTIFIVTAIIFNLTFVILLVLCPFYYLGYAIWLNLLTKTFKKSNVKLTFSESIANSARAHNLSTLWLLAIICFLFIVAGIYIIGQSPKGLYIGILSIAFFGFGGCVIFKMIEIKKEDQQKNRSEMK